VNCGANTTSGTCPSPQCGWSTSLTCGGTPAACASVLTGPACQAAGCTLTPAGLVCGGTPTPCDQLSVANCTKQPGCQIAN
jgi:hypothetical protein